MTLGEHAGARACRPPPRRRSRRRPGTRSRRSASRPGSTRPSVIPASTTTAGARWTGTPRNRSYGISPPSRSIATLRPGSSSQHLAAGVPLDAALGEGLEQRVGRRRRRRDRPPEVDHQRDLRLLAQPALDEVLVQQQRGLARRRRALVRRREHADDDAAALEALAAPRAPRIRPPPCRTRGRPRSARASPRDRGRRRARPPARRPRTSPASVSTRSAAGSIDRIVVWTNRTPGLTMSRRGGGPARATARPNITSSLENPNTNASLLVDQDDLDRRRRTPPRAAWSAPVRRTRPRARRRAPGPPSRRTSWPHLVSLHLVPFPACLNDAHKPGASIHICINGILGGGCLHPQPTQTNRTVTMRKIQSQGVHHITLVGADRADLDRLLGGRARDAVHLRAAQPRQRRREPPVLRPGRRAADHGLHQRGAHPGPASARRPTPAACTMSPSRCRRRRSRRRSSGWTSAGSATAASRTAGSWTRSTSPTRSGC